MEPRDQPSQQIPRSAEIVEIGRQLSAVGVLVVEPRIDDGEDGPLGISGGCHRHLAFVDQQWPRRAAQRDRAGILHIQNARLLEEERAKQHLEEELNVARTIQTGLLPAELPKQGWFRACGSSIASRQVGGDYFDVRRLSPDLYACVIADVSGKGVSAALLAALLQGAFVFASDGGASANGVAIDDIMTRVNRFLIERARGEKYATIVYCTINRNGELRWSNAGHPKPVVVRSSGELERLESTGLPIGMLDVAPYEVKTMQLRAGDKIVFFSDGLSEAANADGEFFEKKALKDLLCIQPGADCEELHAKLVEAVEDFSETSEQEDDITTLVVEYLPEPAP